MPEENQPPELPNQRDKKRVAEDLTKGGHALKGVMIDGVRFITYNLNATPKDNLASFGVTSLSEVHAEGHIKKLKSVFKEIENFANVRFVPTDSKTPNISVFLGEGMDKAYAAYNSDYGQEQQIVLKPDAFYTSLAHEVGHALGLKHPEQFKASEAGELAHEAGGWNQKYDKGYSTMSYNDCEEANGKKIIFGSYFGPADIAALQHYYGEPKNTSPHEHINTKEGIPPTIYSKNPVNIEVSEDSKWSQLTLPDSTQKGLRKIAEHRIAFGTQIQSVRVSPSISHAFTLVGNDLVNILQTGSGDDEVVSAGAGDVLLGGKGVDRFVLSKNALDTVLVDATKEDWIVFPEETQRILLTRIPMKNQPATQIQVFDVEDNLISSAIVTGATPKDVRLRASSKGELNIEIDDNLYNTYMRSLEYGEAARKAGVVVESNALQQAPSSGTPASLPHAKPAAYSGIKKN